MTLLVGCDCSIIRMVLGNGYFPLRLVLYYWGTKANMQKWMNTQPFFQQVKGTPIIFRVRPAAHQLFA